MVSELFFTYPKCRLTVLELFLMYSKQRCGTAKFFCGFGFGFMLTVPDWRFWICGSGFGLTVQDLAVPVSGS